MYIVRAVFWGMLLAVFGAGVAENAAAAGWTKKATAATPPVDFDGLMSFGGGRIAIVADGYLVYAATTTSKAFNPLGTQPFLAAPQHDGGSIAVDSTQNVYVLDFNSNIWEYVNSSKQWIEIIARPGQGPQNCPSYLGMGGPLSAGFSGANAQKPVLIFISSCDGQLYEYLPLDGVIVGPYAPEQISQTQTADNSHVQQWWILNNGQPSTPFLGSINNNIGYFSSLVAVGVTPGNGYIAALAVGSSGGDRTGFPIYEYEPTTLSTKNWKPLTFAGAPAYGITIAIDGAFQQPPKQGGPSPIIVVDADDNIFQLTCTTGC
ncbi:MAG TPA: hypothetical protein VFA71_07385 [Terriglobales bacterium]|nr:hypothetical protein [Terriglobales bacterium]